MLLCYNSFQSNFLVPNELGVSINQKDNNIAKFGNLRCATSFNHPIQKGDDKKGVDFIVNFVLGSVGL